MGENEKSNGNFQLATEFVAANSSRLDTDVLLKLYARYKQAKEGSCHTAKPGFLDFQGKQKWDAWKRLGTMSCDQAKQEYVDLVTKANPDWKSKVHIGKKKGERDSSGAGGTLGVAVSVMANKEEVLDDNAKTIFDWCKDGRTKKVAKLLRSKKSIVDHKDSEGMVLLHWACDRGDQAMVKTLLDNGATINVQDADGQTALHYAVSCEHFDVVKLLLQHNAKTCIVDTDGQSVTDLLSESSQEIRDFVTSYPAR